MKSTSIYIVTGRWLMIVVLALLQISCNGKDPQSFGPVVELDTKAVIERINSNNRQISNLWSRLDITVETPEEKHSVGGYLILRKPAQYGQPPRDLLLRGSDSIGAAEFQLGSNSDGYWYMLDVPGSENDVYSFVPYGQEDSSDQARQALDVLSVLGVYELPDRLDREPWPVSRGYDDEPAYYVISFLERQADQSLRVGKDISWNRRTQRVDLIELFDERGHLYLSADLDDYQKFGAAELATKIHIVWHEQKVILDLTLRGTLVNAKEKVSDRTFMHRKPDWAGQD